MSINNYGNPFQGSYLLNYGKTPAPAKPQTQEELEEEQKKPRNNFFKSKNFVDDQLRARNANAQRKKKDNKENKFAETADALQPKNMRQKMQQLSQQKHEVTNLQKQLAATNDPSIQQKL